MSIATTDNRIFRRLRTAYAQLVQQKKIDTITVTDLTEQADMARATFYLHYKNMDEFRDECFKYIATTSIRQCGLWFEAGRNGIAEAGKKKNLLMGQSDRDLLRFYMLQQVYKEYHNLFIFFDIPTGMHIFTDKWSDTFIEQNSGKLTVFFTGCLINIMPHLHDYNSKKLQQEMLYIFEIWDYLFPEPPKNN